MKWVYVMLTLTGEFAISGSYTVNETIPPASARNIQTAVLNLSRRIQLCRKLISDQRIGCRYDNNSLVTQLRKSKKHGSKLDSFSPIKNLFTDCNDIIQFGKHVSDAYPIWLKVGYRFIHIHCDMESGSHITNKTGWITFQQRKNGKINFNRGWEDYVNGFGNPNEDYWTGLENILRLTGQNEVAFSFGYSTLRPNLRVDLKGWDEFHAYVEYERFTLYFNSNYATGALAKRYGNAFQINYPHAIFRHEFSTFDHINKITSTDKGCPGPHNSGWWFSSCSLSNLNGVYQGAMQKMSQHGIYWHYWPIINPNNTALKYASMKIQY